MAGLPIFSLYRHVFAGQPGPLQKLRRGAGWDHAEPALAESRPGQLASQVLGVVARRLAGESVLLVLAVRETARDHLLHGIRELDVEGLAPDDARALLGAAVPGSLDDGVRERLVAETRR